MQVQRSKNNYACAEEGEPGDEASVHACLLLIATVPGTVSKAAIFRFGPCSRVQRS